MSAPEPQPSALLDEVLVDGAATVLSHSVDITVADVADRAEYWARILREKGVEPGCAVALQIAPSHTLIYLVLAVWRLDAQVMLIDFRLTQAETDAILDTHRPYAYLRDVRAAGQGVLTSFVEDREIDIEVREHTPADPRLCLMQFTSGTSGQPKAVGRTARDLLEEVARFDAIEGCVEPGERVLLLNSEPHLRSGRRHHARPPPRRAVVVPPPRRRSQHRPRAAGTRTDRGVRRAVPLRADDGDALGVAQGAGRRFRR